ncbi:hypothetical protein EJ02DRAFT_429163 [Clathrospora elynae]|uniref:Uncharacterized protein n=1 Tax=Clathrospora elynae TaxID=706981 RepID=A0A6A5S1W7_9PLEO|nr:hypothetical protein EJ02DRAFT_429163 [Clathrospora elynae]
MPSQNQASALQQASSQKRRKLTVILSEDESSVASSTELPPAKRTRQPSAALKRSLGVEDEYGHATDEDEYPAQRLLHRGVLELRPFCKFSIIRS